jgi:two-component system chemotaxis response regulator CheB
MTPDRIIVIGGSSGALEAVRTIVAGLPSDLSAAIFVAIHISPDAAGGTDRVLSKVARMPARYPEDHESIQASHIYIAPPDRHLLIDSGRIRLTRGPRENGFRPAVDPLFRTAAAGFGARVIGVILSGGRDDGSAGLEAIKAAGGTAIVQEPAEAVVPSMPSSAIRRLRVDHVLSANDMAALLTRLVSKRTRGKTRGKAPVKARAGKDVAEVGAHDIHHADRMGPPSPFTCPDCGGVLWQSNDKDPLFHCHVGHRYSMDSLELLQTDNLEQAMWTAVRALEESSELRRRMAKRARDRGMTAIGAGYEEQALESEQRATLIRSVLIPDAASSSAAHG